MVDPELEEKFLARYREFLERQNGPIAEVLQEKVEQSLNKVSRKNIESSNQRAEILYEEQYVAEQRLHKVKLELATLAQKVSTLKDQKQHLRKEIGLVQSRDTLLGTLKKQCENVLSIKGPFLESNDSDGDAPTCFSQFNTQNTILLQMAQQARDQIATLNRNLSKAGGEEEEDALRESGQAEDTQGEEGLKKFLERKKEGYWLRVQKCKDKRRELENERLRYQDLLKRFDDLLEKNEPLIKEKILSNFKRFMNVQCRDTIINFAKELLKEFREESKQDKTLTPSKLTGRERRNLKAALEVNAQKVKNLQALKIRVNEFIADHSLSIINDSIIVYDDLEKALFFFAKHMNTLKDVRLDMIESVDLNAWGSKLLDGLCANSGKVNRPYLSLFFLGGNTDVLKGTEHNADNMNETSRKRFVNSIILGKGNYQQRLKLAGHNVQNLQDEIAAERKLTENLEMLYSSFKNQEGQNFIEFLNLHEGRPISYFLDLWKRTDFHE